ncbi:tRNA (cytosine(72)-C(5))-methyltransferase NSUN6 isoform X1 [Drosophila ananassae]|uniref:tRNA (cytosine(72)-C(5))-methyltransferase NSUN6 isoform X1 n=1 Tax=Drosophila ananassae TaxID=7217 RepID=UPI0013A5E9B1|nr:tRNA (cytosine(72)-C(5))-methyltransferase NSUN6 isoform X1 [Drosophila ananassae]
MRYPKSPFLSCPQLEAEILKVNSTDLAVLLEWLCVAPRTTTYRINTLRSTVADFKKIVLDTLVTRYGRDAPKVYGLNSLPEVLCIDPLDSNRLNYDPDPTLKEVIVDSTCGAALLRGAHIYAPGVLAMEHRTRFEELVNIFADLAGRCKRGTAVRFNSAEKMFLGKGKVLMQRHHLFNDDEPATGVAVEMLSTISDVVPGLGNLSCADALLQNLPSIVCVRVLDPQPGENVLDMCAAPGNKTTHIAELMGDQGCVMALDNSKSRVSTMRSKLNNYRSIQLHVFDSTKAVDALATSISVPPFPCASFDRILLDAPCSGLGNRPQLASKIKQPKVLQSYPNIQRRLFTQAVQLLRDGGTLVYSTCTVTEPECEGIVAWALKKFPDLRLVDATPRWGGPGLPLEDLDASQSLMLQRFGPNKGLQKVGAISCANIIYGPSSQASKDRN